MHNADTYVNNWVIILIFQITLTQDFDKNKTIITNKIKSKFSIKNHFSLNVNVIAN